MKFKTFIKRSQLFLSHNSSIILSGMSLLGLGFTVYNAHQDTLKAEDDYWEKQQDTDEELQYFPTVWKDYIPTAISAGLTAGCIIGNHICSEKQKGALQSAYLLSQTTLQEYQRKVVERIGKNKERDLRNEVITEIAEKQKPQALYSDGGVAGQVIDTGKGTTLFYDEPGDTYFKSDINYIRSVINDLNYELRTEMYFDWNELRYRWGLPFKKYGRDLIFDVDHPLDVRMVPEMMDNGQVRVILDYDLIPHS